MHVHVVCLELAGCHRMLPPHDSVGVYLCEGNNLYNDGKCMGDGAVNGVWTGGWLPCWEL